MKKHSAISRSASEVARIQNILVAAQPTVRSGLGHPSVKHFSPYEKQIAQKIKDGMSQTQIARVLHAVGVGPAKEKVAIQYMNIFVRKFMAKSPVSPDAAAAAGIRAKIAELQNQVAKLKG